MVDLVALWDWADLALIGVPVDLHPSAVDPEAGVAIIVSVLEDDEATALGHGAAKQPIQGVSPATHADTVARDMTEQVKL